MKINIISDLHGFLDKQTGKSVYPTGFELNKLKDADTLVVAGDIGGCASEYNQLHMNLLSEVMFNKFNNVIFCKGNHDFYEINFSPTNFCLPNIEPYGYIHKIDDIVFLTTPMWSPIKEFKTEVEHYINDYNYIQNLTVDITNKMFENSVEFLMNSLEKYKNNKIVIVTHHVPCKELIEEKYLDYNKNPICYMLNEAFTVMHDSEKYGNFVKTIINNYNVPLWIHGHAHSFMDKTIGNTRFVRNPIGYVYKTYDGQIKNECDFKYDFVIEI